VFGSVDLESIGYLGYVHGYHHEVNAIPLGLLEKFLLSLCFCDGCQASAARAGIRIHVLRKTLQGILGKRFSCDHATAKDPQNAEQISTLLALLPELQGLVALRCATISAIVARIREACPHLKLNGFTSSFVGSPSNIWMEGINLSSMKDLLDRIVLLAYGSDPDAVNTDLLMCLSLVEDPAKLVLALNLGLPSTPSLAGASAIVRFAREQKLGEFAFFNYGFLGEGRLRWVSALASYIHA